MSKNNLIPLRSGMTYHILNQGNNGENLFKINRNYLFFLKRYRRYIAPIADTFAWCLMPNHFHILVRFKEYSALHQALPKRFKAPPSDLASPDDLQTLEHLAYDAVVSKWLSRQFADAFSGYTLAINNEQQPKRKGKLFSLPFNRVLVSDDAYFEWLIIYIHRNPIHHGFCKSFDSWPYSSYHAVRKAFLQKAGKSHNLLDKHVPYSAGDITNKLSPPICDMPFLLDWFKDYAYFEQVHSASVEDFLDPGLRLED